MPKKSKMPWKVAGPDGPEMASTTPGKSRHRGAGPPKSQGRHMGPTMKVDDSIKKMK